MDSAREASANQLNAPYVERWGLLKDVIARLYIDEKKKIKDVVEIMKAEYQFYASESQYKRQFGLWNMKRAISSKKKAQISKVLETRAQQKKSSVVLHNGKVDMPTLQKIRRYMKEEARKGISIWTTTSNRSVDIENLFGHALQCGNRVFMNWNMPAAILRLLKSNVVDYTSPNTSAATPMSAIMVATPSSNAGASPRNPPSPNSAPSPNNERSAMTLGIQESLKSNRAHLFVQKHHKELLRGMNLQEQCITTDWMHQFWQYAFITARTWGRGPRVWNSSNLRFNQFFKENTGSFPSTPALNAKSPEQHFHYQNSQEKSPEGSSIQKPSDLCRWSIHYREFDYESVNSPPPTEQPVAMDDEDEWKSWTVPRTIHDFVDSLQHNLESNDFSTIKVSELPISSGQIARAAKRSPEQLLEEAFGFSIMARNRDLVNSMIEHIENSDNFSLHDLFPLHLASSYLDGSKTCCCLFDDIVMGMPVGEASVRKLYINHLNHTVLDNLMIAILKAHTSCTPIMVDEAFNKEYRFAGEEVDICGRWDADSDCIRQLQANGSPTIPQDWKHMFCHTSAQAITHCIGTLFSPHWGPDINTPSGLFLKRCLNETCGLKLQLRPLHTLVVTAVYLAQLGRDGENLFGMIACLLSLLGKGANPLLKAHISLKALLSDDDTQECSHSELDPLELAQRVPYDLISKWSQERIIGWKIFCAVLRLSKNEWSPSKATEPTKSTSEDKFQSIYGIFVENLGESSEIVGLPAMDIYEETQNNKEDEYETRDEDEDESEHEGIPAYCPDHYDSSYQENFFGKSKSLATLWAAVQTELLSYRRLAEGDPWISANFDMESVLESLENGYELSIGLVSKGMMKPFCRCGIFCNSDDPACLRVEEASAYYFSNLEDWTRSTFLHGPDDRLGMWASYLP